MRLHAHVELPRHIDWWLDIRGKTAVFSRGCGSCTGLFKGSNDLLASAMEELQAVTSTLNGSLVLLQRENEQQLEMGKKAMPAEIF